MKRANKAALLIGDLAILRNTYRPKKSRFVQAQSIVVGISVVETKSRPECIMVKPLIDLVPSLLRSANEASTSCPFQLVPSWEEGVVSCCESKVSVLFVGSALGFRTLLFLCVPPLHRKGNPVHFYFVVKSWTCSIAFVHGLLMLHNRSLPWAKLSRNFSCRKDFYFGDLFAYWIQGYCYRFR